MDDREIASAEQLGAELLSTVARFNRWATRHAEWALPAAQARLLAQIEELGAARIGDLARADHCTQPAMTAQIHRLEAAGLVRRRPDPADGRATQIALTDAGQATLVEVRQARAEAINPLLQGLGSDRRGQLQSALDTLSELMADISSSPCDENHREKS